ncbi:MAG TPA: NAD(P)-dependent oxidoreductase [Candidatus Baltobacteraceae bacterium]|nr:NAD(P)-dependent oxidoreductase [Candidatus Baltobacteraceae bacterium]
METVAFYGAGMLGSGFVQALRRRGVDVRVWNRTFEKAKALEAYGAHAMRSPAEAARGASRVHLCLHSDESVDSTLDAALEAIAPGTPVVDHTTVLPQNVVPRRDRLNARGIAFLHAPVFMGPPNAAAATGLMLASGDQTLFERLRPFLEPMTGTVWYVGERADAAAVFKLMGNAMILAVVGGLNDMFTIAQANGIDRASAYMLFERYDPSGQISGRGKRMSQGDYDPTWTLDMAHKDARLMLDTAQGYDLHAIGAVERLLREASARGFGALDLAAIAQVPASAAEAASP